MEIYESKLYLEDVEKISNDFDFSKFRNKKILITDAGGKAAG